MKPRDLANLGVPEDCIPFAIEAIKAAFRGRLYQTKEEVTAVLSRIIADPKSCPAKTHFHPLSREIARSVQLREEESVRWGQNPFATGAAFARWGGDIDEGALEQMRVAMELPVAVAGAVMPDAHLGYGLPVGGVLATYDSVIPYAVGVDIACMMRLSVLDTSPRVFEDTFGRKCEPLVRALNQGTAFGMGSAHAERQHHPVMDGDWGVTQITKALKDTAWKQLGSSGTGNHFVEFGLLTLDRPELGLSDGTYVALLSHSGSRKVGGAVCGEYRNIAVSKLPKAYKRFEGLAWLPMSSEAGQEYWAAMSLMGDYAAANHAVIHELVTDRAGARVLASVTNKHNLCWKETHNGQDLYVHRKGATPADEGLLGIIPGSMATPAYVVRGKGTAASLRSAAHGAGRRMSRNKARANFTWGEWNPVLRQRGVRLLAGGCDELPGAYKDIEQVMADQTDLVSVIGRFDPKIVRMAADGMSED